MKPMAMLAAVCWVSLVGGNVIRVLTSNPEAMRPFEFLPWEFGLFPMLILVAFFFRPKSPKSHEFIIDFWDRKFGYGAWDEFSRMVRAELMFFTMCCGIVIANIVRGYAAHQFPLPPVLSVFFVSGAILFLTAHFVAKSRRRTPL